VQINFFEKRINFDFPFLRTTEIHIFTNFVGFQCEWKYYDYFYKKILILLVLLKIVNKNKLVLNKCFISVGFKIIKMMDWCKKLNYIFSRQKIQVGLSHKWK
jgi:hypothetical protein